MLNCYYRNGKLSAILFLQNTQPEASNAKNIAVIGKKLLAEWSKRYGTRAPVYTTKPGFAGVTKHSWNLPDKRLIRLDLNEDYTELDLFVGIADK